MAMKKPVSLLSEVFFQRVEASPADIKKRRPVYGVGVNDAPYKINFLKFNRKYVCPYYSRWVAMLQRCFSETWQTKNPTYKGCTVANQWLLFSTFSTWMAQQDWEGKHLDKDLLKPGNKKYGPDFCMFVSPQVNTLIYSKKKASDDRIIEVAINEKEPVRSLLLRNIDFAQRVDNLCITP